MEGRSFFLSSQIHCAAPTRMERCDPHRTSKCKRELGISQRRLDATGAQRLLAFLDATADTIRHFATDKTLTRGVAMRISAICCLGSGPNCFAGSHLPRVALLSFSEFPRSLPALSHTFSLSLRGHPETTQRCLEDAATRAALFREGRGFDSGGDSLGLP